MQRRAVDAELQHVPQHRDPPSVRLGPSLAQQTERRDHGSGIGVVALIDDVDVACRKARAASLEGDEIPQRLGRRLYIHAQFPCCEQRRNRVHGDMCAGRTGGKSEAVPVKLRDDPLSFAMRVGGEKARIRVAARSEGENPLHAGIKGVCFQAIALRIVGGKNGGAARLHAFENLGLGVGDGFDVPEIFEMGWGYGGDQRHMGANKPVQCANLAGMVHADLEHTESRFALHPREAERDAPMIVVGSGRRRDGCGRAQHQAQHFLGRGLAGTSGDRDDFRVGSRASGAAQILEALLGVADDQKRRARGDAIGHTTDEGSRRTVFQRGSNEAMAIARIPLQRDEEVAALDAARVDGDAVHRPIAVRLSARGAGGFV